MDKYEIVRRIENFAPPETQEKWDCSGWIVETGKCDIQKIMLCLTVTQNIVNQAVSQNCDMIISHHPLFSVPLEWHIDIYCAHTNLDLAKGGTTDILVQNVFPDSKVLSDNFLRFVEKEIDIKDFIQILKHISPNFRYVNNNNVKTIHKIAFCAGSGSEFIQNAFENGADALVTGDIKFHTALESPIVLFDIGHFESEIAVLRVFENLINNDAEIVYADEKSPLKYA